MVDPDPEMRARYRRELRRDRHEPTTVSTRAATLTAIRRAAPDLVLLEWTYSDGTPTDVHDLLAAGPDTRTVPFVFVSTRGSEAHRLRGLELGAQDYVVKPFSMRELLLRIQAVLRRAARRPAHALVERGRLALDPEAYRAWVDGREILLARIELKLLGALVDGDGRVLSRETLLDSVWGEDATVLDRTVDVTMLRLRRKLGPAAEYLEAVRGVGYRFVAPAAGARPRKA